VETFASVVRVLYTGAIVYAGCGAIFATAFLISGVARIDEAAKDTGVGFRLLIAPGVITCWPLLLMRWLRGQEPPMERNAHRCSVR
jgi:hypothetical protein